MFEVFRRKLTVLRQSGGYFNGLWQDDEIQTFGIQASVQGTNAFVLQTLPEFSHVNATYTLRCDTKLLIGIPGISTPDIVIIDDERFQVVRVTPWQNLLKHYEVVVTRENIDAN